MNKFISILMILVVSISLSTCANKETNVNVNSPKIELASLTKEESNILQLFGVDTTSKIFDYVVDGEAKSMEIKQYILDENLEWKEERNSSGNIEDLKGRMAISINNNGSIRIALQDKSGVGSWISDPESSENTPGHGWATSWANNSNIVYNEEIPLAIQINTSSNEIASYGVESFFDTQRLKGHDRVIAITVTFSK